MHPATPPTPMRGPAGTGSSGFTLFELIIVVIILAILAVAVVPLMSGASETTEARAAARVIGADLEYAQSYAVTYRKVVTVTFVESPPAYTVADPSGTISHPVSHKDYVIDLSSEAGLDGAELDVDIEGGLVLKFDETGAPDKDGKIQVTSGDASATVKIIQATGRVLIQE